jgi:hypothetical protein
MKGVQTEHPRSSQAMPLTSYPMERLIYKFFLDTFICIALYNDVTCRRYG